MACARLKAGIHFDAWTTCVYAHRIFCYKNRSKTTPIFELKIDQKIGLGLAQNHLQADVLVLTPKLNPTSLTPFRFWSVFVTKNVQNVCLQVVSVYPCVSLFQPKVSKTSACRYFQYIRVYLCSSQRSLKRLPAGISSISGCISVPAKGF